MRPGKGSCGRASLMSRSPALEAILQARFDLDNCSPNQQTDCLRLYYAALDEAIKKSGFEGVTRRELQALLAEPYREFKRSKRVKIFSRNSLSSNSPSDSPSPLQTCTVIATI